ncbi:hypothetical protein Nepgr_030601 [Nepenthes gracilis]|uniref:HMA domain-containing protein n=1 Tax=Nepenthes gracilis TaxID=150966 RepID=A0AAD3TF41_NEPGR|nr:hypothetical protein Nepgr_030601 [Nepenthes gracilis]
MAVKVGEKKGDAAAAKKDDGTVTVVLKLDMHCEGCVRKIRESVKNFDGVESVKADMGDNKLTVIGKVDPIKIKERVEKKTNKTVELVSPQPMKERPQVSAVVLKTGLYCDGCAETITRIIKKYKGVEDVNVDLQKQEITVKGTMNKIELLSYLNKEWKRAVEIRKKVSFVLPTN